MECRISFTLVLTVLTLTLSLVPAITIWVVFMDLMTSSVDLLKGVTQNSTDTMAQRIEEMLMAEAVDSFDALLTEGETEMVVYQALMQSSGLLQRDLHASHFDSLRQFLTPFQTFPFVTMKGHTLFSTLAISGGIFSTDPPNVGGRAFLLTCTALFFDVSTNTAGNRTLYLGTMALTPNQQYVQYNTSYVSQVTGAPTILLMSQMLPAAYLTMTYVPSGWDTQLSFNEYSGQVQLTRWQWLPAQNNTWVQVALSISAETMSEGLQAQLTDSPDDRLVLFFRQPEGYMIAASHGKFYSHSDVDRRFVNPLTNPPNLTSYHLWTCLQSDDALIQEACQQLYATYKNWTAIPALREETVLGGQRYWLGTDFSTGSTNLQCTVLMLKNRASVMGSIDAGNAEVDRSVAEKKNVTFVVLGVISAVAVLLPLGVGLWLASRLYKLAAGMDRIAKMQFETHPTPRSMFQELHRFQTSFVQMERGLQAFGKFVPQAVVKVLVAGQMNASDEMHPETLTIMFADIEGFSTFCENVPPSVLVTVCTEYFEAMCNTIAQQHGTIDKFIGDCIMAIWNAPERIPGHERDAVAAALAMQSGVMNLHSTWWQRGLPLLKFRLGVHTSTCLVGNFGCSYRVNYTCLGDGVNLAARLEPLNKKFGTYLCVSHATYQGCRDDFHFRKLGKVTVPGKTEVLPVYEVLCEVTRPQSPKVCGLKVVDMADMVDVPDMLGTVNLHAAPDLLAPDPSHLSVGYASSPLVSPRAKNPELTSELPGASRVPYHWAYVDRAALLRQAADYEEAYEAMVDGDLGEARHLLMSEPLLDIPDKAWAALGGQLDRLGAGALWDGVFYFREK